MSRPHLYRDFDSCVPVFQATQPQENVSGGESILHRAGSSRLDKQQVAIDLLRRGIAEDTIRIPHQALMEFMAVTICPLNDGTVLLSVEEARQDTEEMLVQFDVLYPNATVVRTALRGMAAYQLNWFDAHIWAYAECFGLSEIYSEDFQHDRLHGNVRTVNPFI